MKLFRLFTIINCFINLKIIIYYLFSGRTVRPGNGRSRIILVILWKQYSDRKFFGFFPMISDRFLRESTGNWQESTEKNLQFPVGILLPRSSDFRCFPAGYVDFPASFLHNPAGFGGRNLRPGLKSNIK